MFDPNKHPMIILAQMTAPDDTLSRRHPSIIPLSISTLPADYAESVEQVIQLCRGLQPNRYRDARHTPNLGEHSANQGSGFPGFIASANHSNHFAGVVLAIRLTGTDSVDIYVKPGTAKSYIDPRGIMVNQVQKHFGIKIRVIEPDLVYATRITEVEPSMWQLQYRIGFNRVNSDQDDFPPEFLLGDWAPYCTWESFLGRDLQDKVIAPPYVPELPQTHHPKGSRLDPTYFDHVHLADYTPNKARYPDYAKLKQTIDFLRRDLSFSEDLLISWADLQDSWNLLLENRHIPTQVYLDFSDDQVTIQAQVVGQPEPLSGKIVGLDLIGKDFLKVHYRFPDSFSIQFRFGSVVVNRTDLISKVLTAHQDRLGNRCFQINHPSRHPIFMHFKRGSIINNETPTGWDVWTLDQDGSRIYLKFISEQYQGRAVGLIHHSPSNTRYLGRTGHLVVKTPQGEPFTVDLEGLPSKCPLVHLERQVREATWKRKRTTAK